MKKLLLIHFILAQLCAYSKSSETLIYSFEIKEAIQNSVARNTDKAIAEAEKLQADYLIVHMNTFGGEVASADKIRTALLNTEIPTVVFIDNNAASAGALISIACDSIYMRKGANIGAASVVNQTGQKMPEKYQSYMRSIMRSTAESKGQDSLVNEQGEKVAKWRRDPALAEAMVDESVNQQDSTKIVSFTSSEAIENGFCEGEVASMTEIIEQKLHVQKYQLVKHQLTSVDVLINFLINPAVSGVLIMIIIGGIYYELRTPGLGFPIVASIVAAFLFFAPHYLEGLAANWEIACFVVGITLLILEIFVIPGFGLAGIAGVALIFMAFIFSLVDNYSFDKFGFSMDLFSTSITTLFLTLVVTIGLIIFISVKFIKTKMFQNIALRAEQKVEDGYVAFEKVETNNERGITLTPLEPIGKIEIDGTVHPAKAKYGYINKGEKVKVVGHSLGEYEVIKEEEA